MKERLREIKKQIWNKKKKKTGCLEKSHKSLAYLFIWWGETTVGFIDSHFDVKDVFGLGLACQGQRP